MEFEDNIIRKDTEIKTSEKAIKVDKDNILLEDSDIERIRKEVISKDKEKEKLKKEKKANRRAIVSLVLGVASWIGMITVIMPIVGGIWSIVDGYTALKGKTKYKKCAIWGIVLSVLLYASVFTICIYGFVSSSKWEKQLNTYIENKQYTEAQAFIEKEYAVGTLSYVEKCAYLYELQEMYDEAAELWVEYCNNEYRPIDIPDSRINKLNKYLNNYEADLRPETIEKIHNLINSKEAAKAEEQVAKEAEKQVAKEAKEQAFEEAKKQTTKEAEQVIENSTELGVKNNDMVGNTINQANENNISESEKTFYNNGNPHIYKYVDKDYHIVAKLQMDYYDDSTFFISLRRYDYDNNFATYNCEAWVSLIQDEKGNDHGANGTYYRGADRDSGADVFIEFNYETEYCKIRMTMPMDDKGYNFDYIFDHEDIYYPEEADGVDDGIADLDHYTYPGTFFIEENIGKTFRFSCSYVGIKNGYMEFYFNSGSIGFSVFSKTDKDFGSFFSGDGVQLTAVWKGLEEVGDTGYDFIVDIIDLQINK